MIIGAAGVLAVDGVQAVRGRDARSWGTFTQQERVCEWVARSRSCTEVGTWVSDDGTARLRGVELRGHLNGQRSVRAALEGPLEHGAHRRVVVTEGELRAAPWRGLFLVPLLALVAWMVWNDIEGERAEDAGT